MLWLPTVVLSACVAGLTATLEKCRLQRTDSDAANALCTVVVRILVWIKALVVGAADTLGQLFPGRCLEKSLPNSSVGTVPDGSGTTCDGILELNLARTTP